VDGEAAEPEPGWIRDRAGFSEVIHQLTEYFARKRRRFSLSLRLGGTPFQMAVWSALGKIPYGETRSYRDVARAIRRPLAMRAVGAANGNNPIPIIIPCHRVIGAHGDLVGFGGGLVLKKFLLELEGVRVETSRSTSGSVTPD
jgi:methylated-DNA-[protein]-cysteine S-methyltransferase